MNISAAVSTYTTVSTVGPPPTLGGRIDLDVLDNEVRGVKTLAIGIGLSVLQEVSEEGGRLDGPAAFGSTGLFCCKGKK